MESYTGDIKNIYYGRIEKIWKHNYAGENAPMFHVRSAKSVTKEDHVFTTMFIYTRRKQSKDHECHRAK
jgi:hypothetical protein